MSKCSQSLTLSACLSVITPKRFTSKLKLKLKLKLKPKFKNPSACVCIYLNLRRLPRSLPSQHLKLYSEQQSASNSKQKSETSTFRPTAVLSAVKFEQKFQELSLNSIHISIQNTFLHRVKIFCKNSTPKVLAEGQHPKIPLCMLFGISNTNVLILQILDLVAAQIFLGSFQHQRQS